MFIGITNDIIVIKMLNGGISSCGAVDENMLAVFRRVMVASTGVTNL